MNDSPLQPPAGTAPVDARPARRKSHPGPARRALLEALGLHGLTHLDAPVLAALATETPMLLIGPHGSAKSALLERLAAALGLDHRHYNASLLSFDDLVGFPVPDGDALRYLRTPATLWGAQSVFLDEISRCRPEVQNKLFSIVHEKRIQGIALPDLRYRWAAMNPPPAPDADDGADPFLAYAGCLPLDAALADRFGFVLPLPGLDELPAEARREVIRGGLSALTPAGPADGGVSGMGSLADAAGSTIADAAQASARTDLAALVEACRQGARLCAALHGHWITAWVAALVAPLRQAGLAISGRRAAMLAANTAAVHAARRVLGIVDATDDPLGEAAVADAALSALRHSLPQRAQGLRVDAGVIATLHRQAVEAAARARTDATLARILEEVDPVRRVGRALAALARSPGRVPRSTMSALVADALAAQSTQGRWILAQELLPALAELDAVDAPTLELLAEPFVAQVGFEQRPELTHTVPRSRFAGFEALVASLGALDSLDPAQVALGNLGATLYARDEGASEPALLARQQANLRERLAVADDDGWLAGATDAR
jgi:MoxR-like ATPase